MIALDTNVLVRFLVEDDPEQTARARSFLQRSLEEDSTCFVSDIVLCEVVWVLGSVYRISRPTVVEHLSALLRTRQLAFSSTDRVGRALAAFRSGRGDFADYLIREHAWAAGCEAVATFERRLLAEEGFLAP